MVPDEFPKEAAHAHLVFRSQHLAGVNRVFEVGKGTVADGLTPNLVAEADKSGSRNRIVALDGYFNQMFQSLIIVENVYWI